MEAAESGALVVLLVEDEALLRLDAADELERAGFVVLQAADADQAIDILHRRGDIRIVFTDVDMPGSMDGLKLARAVRERWPPIALMVTSGRRALHEADLPSGGRFIPKPYSGRQIVQAVFELTGS